MDGCLSAFVAVYVFPEIWLKFAQKFVFWVTASRRLFLFFRCNCARLRRLGLPSYGCNLTEEL
ncbi:MAG: hypothetical protein AVDCRST_MAG56-1558 [uncultured Cytophagales bacterium]|uniref:Uncharacterized protein n=1 Tax=uncultured Cytophagales bacterium TaxID=158755 RepID=A0A6J4I6U3_9SPHI|nr:MAG: hypothetical protein AVDCRST_MAG56-1558 [uncultured Cytophagales bacterium]